MTPRLSKQNLEVQHGIMYHITGFGTMVSYDVGKILVLNPISKPAGTNPVTCHVTKALGKGL